MVALREVFAEFGISFDKKRELDKGDRSVKKVTKELDKLDKEVKDVERSEKKLASTTQDTMAVFQRLGAVLGASALAMGFRDMVTNTVESTNELGRWSERLGITIQDMYAWQQVAARFGGTTDDITDAFKELQLKARDAMTGTQSYIDAFGLLGITVQQLTPIVNDQNALMDLFTGALNRNTSAATQNFVADELMSDAGTRLLPMFRQGTTELHRLREEAGALGGRDMPQLARETRAYTLAEARLNQTWTATKNTLMLRVIPALTSGVEKLREWFAAGREVAGQSHIVEAAVAALGLAAATAGVMAVAAWGPAILTFAGVAAALAGVALLFDDIYMAVNEEGDTVTNRFLEWALGAKGAADALLGLRTAWADWIEFRDAYNAWWLGAAEQDESGNFTTSSASGTIQRGLQLVTTGNLDPLTRTDKNLSRERLGNRRAQGAALDRSLSNMQNSWGLELDLPQDQTLTEEETRRLRREQFAMTGTRGPVMDTTAANAALDVRARRELLPPMTTPSIPRGDVRIDAPATINVTVNESTNARETEHIVTEGIRRELSRQARDLEEMTLNTYYQGGADDRD